MNRWAAPPFHRVLPEQVAEWRHSKDMSRITKELLQKRSEHHDGLLEDLEEISLHQSEIERIEVIGSLCPKLRILYLQNNIIPRIENIRKLKDLTYLNLALNNIKLIEGLSQCEFLEKLDLTVNFVPAQRLKASCEHLAGLRSLRVLYLMGNPCTDWTHFKEYVIAKVPQLLELDGHEISRTERIRAVQQLPRLEEELRQYAAERELEDEAKREEKQRKKAVKAAAAAGGGAGGEQEGKRGDGGSAGCDGDNDDDDEDDAEEWSPEAREAMYREMAADKEEEAKRKNPHHYEKRDYAKEHAERVAREKAEAAAGGKVRQRNEGKWDFSLLDEDGYGNCVLTVDLPRFLDTSLVDVDAHPNFVSLVAKGKLFRVAWPDEVRSEACQARRLPSGTLELTAPKVDQKPALMRMRRKELQKEPAQRAAAAIAERKRRGVESGRVKLSPAAAAGGEEGEEEGAAGAASGEAAGGASLMDEMMRAAAAAGATGAQVVPPVAAQQPAGGRSQRSSALTDRGLDQGAARAREACTVEALASIARRRQGADPGAAPAAAVGRVVSQRVVGTMGAQQRKAKSNKKQKKAGRQGGAAASLIQQVQARRSASLL